MPKQPLKYHNRTFLAEGVRWDSKLEYRRWLYLRSLQDKGLITRLQRQVRFEIIPAQTCMAPIQRKTKVVYRDHIVERAAIYTADFVYHIVIADIDYEVVEDVKSEQTRKLPDYVLRRKLMRLNGHPIVEVSTATATPSVPK